MTYEQVMRLDAITEPWQFAVIASHWDTDIAHAMLHAAALAEQRERGGCHG